MLMWLQKLIGRPPHRIGRANGDVDDDDALSSSRMPSLEVQLACHQP